MAKLSRKVKKICDALDLVPLSKIRKCGTCRSTCCTSLDIVLECRKAFETKYATSKYHQAWLCALKQAISKDDSAEEDGSVQLL